MKYFIIPFLILVTGKIHTQNVYQDSYYSQPFDHDSLAGFDEIKARQLAIAENYTGSELKIKMRRLRRAFLVDKYHLESRPPQFTQLSRQTATQTPWSTSLCDNEDFESSPSGWIFSANQIAGWSLTEGINDSTMNSGSNSCNLVGCCPNAPTQSAIIDCNSSTGYIDYLIGTQYPVYSVFGSGTVTGSSAANPHILGGMFGSKVLRLNDNSNNYGRERLLKSFSVSANDTLFAFALLPVVSKAHLCCDAAGIQLMISDSIGPIATYSFFAPSSQCSSTPSCEPYLTTAGDGGYMYHRWIKKILNLKQYLGQTLNIEVVASDCNAGGHFCYTYFDAECQTTLPKGNFKIYFDGKVVTDTTRIVNLVSCGSNPVIFSDYPLTNWSGQTFSNVTANYVTIYSPGSYTLNASYTNDCAVTNITKIYNITFFKGIKIISSDSTICLGESATLSSNGNPIFHWSTGDTTKLLSVSPTSDTQFTLTCKDSIGCLATTVFTQKVEQCTSIGSLKSDKYATHLYPNPNCGSFIYDLKVNFSNAELIIESFLGQILFRQAVNRGKNEIELQGLVNGIYSYRVISNNALIDKGKLQIE